MNYLAHAFLSADDDGILIGNIIGDLITNAEVQQYPDDIQQGIRLHRSIDSYSDTHPRIRKMTQKLYPHFGKYAPVVNDIYSDYLLSHMWEQVTSESLEGFCHRMYGLLNQRTDDLYGRAKEIVPRMIADNWLEKYQYLEHIDHIFKRLAQRAKFVSHFNQAIPVLEQYQDDLTAQLLLFIREAQQYFGANGG